VVKTSFLSNQNIFRPQPNMAAGPCCYGRQLPPVRHFSQLRRLWAPAFYYWPPTNAKMRAQSNQSHTEYTSLTEASLCRAYLHKILPPPLVRFWRSASPLPCLILCALKATNPHRSYDHMHITYRRGVSAPIFLVKYVREPYARK
jgi:hypothetical protein